AGRDLLRARRLDRDRVLDLKLQALEALFARFPGDPGLDAYREREGETLELFATFCVLCEHHGRRWREWPAELRHPGRPEVRAFAVRHAGRIRFHAWLQWQLDRQLAAAATELPPIHDLAVGVDPDGADAWLFQDVLARGVTVGAPPDPFAAQGQDWSVPPFDPWRLRRAAYEPFVRTLRANLRHGLGLRIDHVMGLFRLFWIPEGLGPQAGAYVRYPHRELLGILALESRRAGALVVGEDLGTVEADVRAELQRHRVLSYRLLWFEQQPPAGYPAEALAALTTHDLPTLAGIWEGADPDPGIRDRLRRHGGVREGASVAEAAAAAYGTLAASPCRLVAATLEDALGVVERPNRPGTGDPDNWSLALPVALPALLEDPRPRELVRRLRRPPAAAGPE
ncbi:MAG: 4-alpha-glucanotransferase, partial [Candidatus Dormibacteraeota bacterium]|nr:4-alpha-glucanotransferase [Candidatus Dormibacteraeota bacterium]MBO0760611.1 4-alpha-glucanotransferase [Candidatus Dormibacteraeota bacterium]